VHRAGQQVIAHYKMETTRILLEEYGPMYVHIAGESNIFADALSRIEKMKMKSFLKQKKV
jgi:hypothetical protein